MLFQHYPLQLPLLLLEKKTIFILPYYPNQFLYFNILLKMATTLQHKAFYLYYQAF